MVLVVAACGGNGGGERSAGGEVAGDEFSLAISEPEHLMPPNTTDVYGSQVLSALFTGLVVYDVATGEPRNAMATSITSTDQRTWTVTLEDGWTFHNGERVTAESYVDAWNFGAYAGNAMGNASFYSKIEGYDALQGDPEATPPVEPSATEMTGLTVVDDLTFTVTLEEPFSQFPITLGYQAYYPLPAAALRDPKGYEDAPVGNGPFMMDGSWRHDEGIRVVAYPDYPGPPPKADAVEFVIYSADGTATRDLQGDNLDIIRSVPIQDVATLRAEFPDGLVERQGSEFSYLGFPLHEPAFQNKLLRQAFSMAIDRRLIIDKILAGANEPAGSVVAPVVPGARSDVCAACRYDPARARELLAEAGGWDGTLTLWYRTGQDNDAPMEAIANQLRQNLGIESIEFETLEFSEFFTKIKQKEVTGPFRLSWLMDYPSVQSYLEPLYTSTSSSNRAGYANADVDALIAEANRASTFEAGLAAYHAAEDIILDEVPVIPLWFGKVYAAHSERVAGVAIDPLHRIRVQDVQVVG